MAKRFECKVSTIRGSSSRAAPAPPRWPWMNGWELTAPGLRRTRPSMSTATGPTCPTTASGWRSRMVGPGSPRSRTIGSPTVGAVGHTLPPDCTGSPATPGVPSPTTTAAGTCMPATAGSGSRAPSTLRATCTGTGAPPMWAGSPAVTTIATTSAGASAFAGDSTGGQGASGIRSTPGFSAPRATSATAGATPTAGPCASGIRSSHAASSRRTRTASTIGTGGIPRRYSRSSSANAAASPKASCPTSRTSSPEGRT